MLIMIRCSHSEIKSLEKIQTEGLFCHKFIVLFIQIICVLQLSFLSDVFISEIKR